MDAGEGQLGAVDQLMAERWPTGKDAVDAIQLLALRQSKTACVASRGGQFRKLLCSSAGTGCKPYKCSKCGSTDGHNRATCRSTEA